MKNFDPNGIYIKPVNLTEAKKLIKIYHYMKTAPAGALLAFGIYHEQFKGLQGIAIFGKSATTNTKCKLFPEVNPNNILEMQRLWISDALGHNAESKTLRLMMNKIKQAYKQIKLVFTYAGGCKNDCGIVYQSSGFMYLGAEKCEDFYLTDKGEYKNIINVLRFSKAPANLKTKEAKAYYVYGKGQLLKTRRYFYFYPIDKGLRRKMASKCLPFPKNSDVFRKDQKWYKGASEGHG